MSYRTLKKKLYAGNLGKITLCTVLAFFSINIKRLHGQEKKYLCGNVKLVISGTPNSIPLPGISLWIKHKDDFKDYSKTDNKGIFEFQQVPRLNDILDIDRGKYEIQDSQEVLGLMDWREDKVQSVKIRLFLPEQKRLVQRKYQQTAVINYKYRFHNDVANFMRDTSISLLSSRYKVKKRIEQYCNDRFNIDVVAGAFSGTDFSEIDSNLYKVFTRYREADYESAEYLLNQARADSTKLKVEDKRLIASLLILKGQLAKQAGNPKSC